MHSYLKNTFAKIIIFFNSKTNCCATCSGSGSCKNFSCWFSSIVIFIVFSSLTSSETNSYSTLPKIFKDLRLLIDLLKSNSLKGSPSSTSKLSLTTFSSVILFPNIFTFFRYFFSNSFISKVAPTHLH